MENDVDSFPSGSRDPQLLLSAMQRIGQSQVGAAVERSLRRADDYLFDSSAAGGAGAELTALRDLRRARLQIAQRFDQALVGAFRRLQEAPMAVRGVDASSLSLVSDEALEEQLATEQLVDNLQRYHAPSLELLDKRLAVLTERPMLAANENPLGPRFIAEAMSEAMGALEVSTAVRIVLFKFLERELIHVLGGVYERINAGLVAAGILPHIKPTKRAEAPPPPEPFETAGAPRTGAGVDPETAAAATSMASQLGMTGPGDQALFSSLLGLLQAWRMSFRPQGTGQAGPSMSSTQVMSVLSQLQGEPMSAIEGNAVDQRVPLAEQLRRHLLAGARRMGLGGEDLTLSSVDEDAVDLVGMLFEVLLDERNFEPGVRQKIHRLLVPYIKVAVKDRRLFLYKAHPARRLLNVVAEASEGNRGDTPQERDLMERVDGTIDRLVAEFNEDIAIFETLEQELRTFMEQHRKRIEIAERRAAEAQRGRERLEQAREGVLADLVVTRGTRELPPAIETFVGQYAAHHLIQVVLREGRESPRYAAAVTAINGLMAIHDQVELGVPLDRLPALDQAELGAILSSSGLHGPGVDDVIAALRRTLERTAAGDVAGASAEHLPSAAMASSDTAAAPAEAPATGPLDFDPEIAERMRALPVGTWVQLTSDSGRVEPAKVSWISPISSRLLFVNRRGIRVLVASAEELASMAREGRLQLREGDTAFDDAMHQMMGRLRASTPTADAEAGRMKEAAAGIG